VGDDLRVIDSLLAAYSGTTQPGAGVVVIRDDQVVARRAYGMADLERQCPRLAKRLPAGVRLKQFTAMCILLLAQDGSSARSASPHASPLTARPPACRSITIRHLLNTPRTRIRDLIPKRGPRSRR
jgi:CubicO group peptidase (beta-lactamase class C family)